jgi:hypothetical protein
MDIRSNCNNIGSIYLVKLKLKHSYPIDTIRRRLFIRGVGNDKLYSNSWQCAKYIAKNEGWLGFFKGSYINTLRGKLLFV